MTELAQCGGHEKKNWAARDFGKTGSNTSGHVHSLALHASIEPHSIWLIRINVHNLLIDNSIEFEFVLSRFKWYHL